jgi:hypothetical protein
LPRLWIPPLSGVSASCAHPCCCRFVLSIGWRRRIVLSAMTVLAR